MPAHPLPRDRVLDTIDDLKRRVADLERSLAGTIVVEAPGGGDSLWEDVGTLQPITTPDSFEVITVDDGIFFSSGAEGGFFVESLAGGGIFLEDPDGGGIFITAAGSPGGIFLESEDGGGIFLGSDGGGIFLGETTASIELESASADVRLVAGNDIELDAVDQLDLRGTELELIVGFVTLSITAIAADGELGNGDFSIGLDPTPGSTDILFKARDSGGTIRTGSVALT